MTKSELKEIVQKAIEEVWYNRRSLNPIEEQTELITEKLYEALILPVVGITFKEKIEKEIVELREELAKLLNDKLGAYTSVDDWSDKIAFITGKIEGLKSALN